MNDDFESRVRDMMRAESGRAPDDYPVVQSVLREVHGRPVVEGRPRWRTWTIPLIAAGAVAAVAATVVGVQSFRPSAHHTVTVGGSNSPTSPVPDSAQPDVTPTASAPSPATTTVAASSTALAGYHIVDLTYVGDTAWALASTNCLSPSGCPAVVAESVHGGAWTRLSTPDPESCSGDACATNIRFATTQVGYVFGRQAFFMTTDGGRSWQRQPGGAAALETLDDNVIRVETLCFPGCPVTVRTAPIGGMDWTARALPGDQPSMTSGLSLVRVQGASYLLLYGHPAGGAGNATSRLFLSTDDGTSWSAKGEPCPQTGGGSAGTEVDSTAIAAGGGGLAVLCAPRGSGAGFVIWTGYDAGTFQPAGAMLDNAFAGPMAVSGKTVLLDTGQGLYRSTDIGANWTQLSISGLANARWLGYETRTDARLVSADGTMIWTTHDAGANWTHSTFP